MDFEERSRFVDELLEYASVSVRAFSVKDLRLAEDFCKVFDIPFGTLIRRTEANRLLDSAKPNRELLSEAAKQLIAKED